MQTYQTIAIVAAVVFGLDFTLARSVVWRIGYLIFTALVTLRGVRALAIHASANLAHPPRYDFLCFWLDGRVALTYHNVYAPAYFHLLGDSLVPRAQRSPLGTSCSLLLWH
jgi:hypothetical protein